MELIGRGVTLAACRAAAEGWVAEAEASVRRGGPAVPRSCRRDAADLTPRPVMAALVCVADADPAFRRALARRLDFAMARAAWAEGTTGGRDLARSRQVERLARTHMTDVVAMALCEDLAGGVTFTGAVAALVDGLAADDPVEAGDLLDRIAVEGPCRLDGGWGKVLGLVGPTWREVVAEVDRASLGARDDRHCFEGLRLGADGVHRAVLQA